MSKNKQLTASQVLKKPDFLMGSVRDVSGKISLAGAPPVGYLGVGERKPAARVPRVPSVTTTTLDTAPGCLPLGEMISP